MVAAGKHTQVAKSYIKTLHSGLASGTQACNSSCMLLCPLVSAGLQLYFVKIVVKTLTYDILGPQKCGGKVRGSVPEPVGCRTTTRFYRGSSAFFVSQSTQHEQLVS